MNIDPLHPSLSDIKVIFTFRKISSNLQVKRVIMSIYILSITAECSQRQESVDLGQCPSLAVLWGGGGGGGISLPIYKIGV